MSELTSVEKVAMEKATFLGCVWLFVGPEGVDANAPMEMARASYLSQDARLFCHRREESAWLI